MVYFMVPTCQQLHSVEIHIQDDQINKAVFFWYLVKRDLSSVRYCTYTCTLDKSRFPRYQKNSAMLNWSPCMLPAECILVI